MRAVALLALVLGAACSGRRAPPLPEGGQPPRLPAPAHVERTSVQGIFHERPFALLVEREGGAIAGVLKLGPDLPVRLRGQQISPGRLVFTDASGEPGRALRLEAALDERGALQGRLNTGRRDEPEDPLTAAPAAPFADPATADFDRGFASPESGLRLRLHKRGAALSGWMRPDGAAGELSLSGQVEVPGGAFVLLARSGDGNEQARLSGTFLDARLAAGRLENPAGAQPLLLVEASPPLVAVDPGGRVRIVPRQRLRTVSPSCTSDVAWPLFVGLSPQPVRDRLEAVLRDKATFETEPALHGQCEADEESPAQYERSIYAVGARARTAAALELRRETFLGGAHPVSALECLVVDLRNGRLLRTHELIGDRPALEELANRKLRALLGVQDLTEKGFLYSKAPLSAAQLCIRNNAVLVHWDAYAVGPYSLGEPSVELPASEAYPHLARHAAVDALLRVAIR